MSERAGAYLRVSSEEQADNNSLATQERDIRTYLADRGYLLVELYREVYTGTLLEARPELRRLRADIEAQRLDVAVVWHSDRLSRDPDDRVYLRVEAHRKGARYESVTDPLGGTDEDRLVQYIQGYAAKQEVRRITERSVANSRARMRSGKLPGGGKPRYGYQFEGEDRGRYVAKPETAWVVRLIFERIADGTPKLTLCKQLMAEGIPAPQGKRWRPFKFGSIIRSPMYRGEAVACRVKTWRDQSGKRLRKLRDSAEGEDGYIPLPDGTVERLVSDDLWNRANTALNRALDYRSTRYAPGTDPEDVLVRGAVRCGVCGFRMCIHRLPDATYLRCQAKQRGAGSCQNMIRAAKIDRAVWNRIWLISTNPDYVQQELERQQRSDQVVEDTRELDKQIREAGTEVDNLATAVGRLSDGSALDTLLARLTDASNRRAALVARKSEIDLQARIVEQQKATVRTWYDHGHELLESIGEWDYKQRRRRLQELGIEVTVWPRTSAKRYEIAASLPVAREMLDAITAPSALAVTRVSTDYPPRSGSPEWTPDTQSRTPACGNSRSGPCAGTAGGSPRRSRTVRPV